MSIVPIVSKYILFCNLTSKYFNINDFVVNFLSSINEYESDISINRLFLNVNSFSFFITTVLKLVSDLYSLFSLELNKRIDCSIW